MATRQAVKASLASLGIKKIDSAAGIDEYRMRNGLKILLRENHSAPVVSFMLVYRVGSRNEAVGHTGSTHFLEHMMFKGTKKFNPASGSGVMETFSRVGALLNATTWLDRTNYYECVPSEYLQLCIQVEADRMRNLNLRQEDRDSEMTVVRNEFERGENNPGSALSKELTALAFREHPYHHPTIGWRTDVEYVPLERLKQFYDTYYWPDNATAIVVGDFDSDKTLRLIEKYFGKIPKSPKPIPQVYTVEPPQEGERRVELRRAGDLPQLIMGYHTPQADHKDTYALSVMQSVLGDSGKRSSRLYKALVEQGLATSCYASNGEFRDPFLFTLGATLAPGKTFEEVESVIYAEIDRLTKEDCSEEELYRIKQSNRKGTILSNADPQSFANMICASESVATWRWLVEYDDNVDAVTPADIRRVASTYFDKTNRTVAHFIPTDTERPRMEFGNPNNGKQQQRQKAAAKVEQKRIDLPKPGSSGSNFAQRVHKEVLPNGMTILVLTNPGTGSVAVHGALSGGDCFASSDRTMTPTVASTMLTRGSQNYTKEQLAHILEEMGIRFGFGADRYKVGFDCEFDSPDDLKKWNILQRSENANAELQCYTPKAATVDNGYLYITGRKEDTNYQGKLRHYTSGILNTQKKLDVIYGRFDIRFKVPKGKGFWPAFWLLPTDARHAEPTERLNLNREQDARDSRSDPGSHVRSDECTQRQLSDLRPPLWHHGT
jgi:zinc protease